MRLCVFSTEIVMERKHFRVLCVLRAFRDSDRKEIRSTKLKLNLHTQLRDIILTQSK